MEAQRYPADLDGIVAGAPPINLTWNWVRHMDAGLAIPDFPLSFGRLVPPHWSTQIALHYAHRVWALAVTALVVALAVRVLRAGRGAGRGETTVPAGLLLILLPVQIALGALTVLSLKHPAVATAHLATGALVLATSLVLAIRLWRPEIERRAALREAVPERGVAAAPLLGS